MIYQFGKTLHENSVRWSFLILHSDSVNYPIRGFTKSESRSIDSFKDWLDNKYLEQRRIR